MKKTLLFSFALFLTLDTYAQMWQWGARAGSGGGGVNMEEEEPKDIATDNNGNVYIISSVYPNAALSVDTNYLDSYFTSNATNILLHSYTCEGTYRWSKVVGTTSGARAKSVQTDTLGGVYILAKIFSNETPIHIGDDTMFTDGNKLLYAIKFDTSGNVGWVRSPISDTISFFNAAYNANPIDMYVDKAGNMTIFTEMPPGNNLDGALTLATPANYAIRYNRFGAFVSTTLMPFQVMGLKATYGSSCYATVAPNGNIVFTGYRFYIPQDTIIAGGDTLNQRAFVVVSSPSGQLLWHQEVKVSTQSFLAYSNSIFLSRGITDEEGNIYVSGGAAPNDTLAGFVFENTSNPVGSAMPILAKFSPTGSLLWCKVGSNTAISLFYGTAYSNNRVACTGMYASSDLHFVGSPLELSQDFNEGRDPLLAVFDAQSGDLLSLDSLSGPFGYDETGYIIGSDTKNNFFVAGNFNSYLTIDDDALQTAGDKDIFVAKYGLADCDFSNPVAVKEIVTDAGIVVHPNPANTTISIQSTNFGVKYVKLYNLLGQCVYQAAAQNVVSELTIDVSTQAKGVYFVHLTNEGNHSVIKKIVIQ